MPSRTAIGSGRGAGQGGTERRRGSGFSHWNVLLGAALMGLAAWYVLDPDYPVTTDSNSESAKPPVVLLPEPLAPVGRVAHEGLEFKWLWKGPETLWELVLLDEAMEELVVIRDIRKAHLVPEGEILAHLAGGGRFHWFVAYSALGQTFRSLPVPFVLPER